MEKFLNLPVLAEVTVGNSGTTTSGGSGSNNLIDTGGTGDFLTTVSVGDIVVNDTDTTSYIVTAVVDDDNLTLSPIAGAPAQVPTAKAYTIYSSNLNLAFNRMVSMQDVVIIEQASTTTATIKYYNPDTDYDLITVTHTNLVSGSEAVRDQLQEAMVEVYRKNWKQVRTSFQSNLDKIGVSIVGVAIT